MNVADMMIMFEMNAWHRFLFWSVNVPRSLLGMDLVVYRCMIGTPIIQGFKRAVITVSPDDVE